MDEDNSKECSRCKRKLSHNKFGVCNQNKDGLQRWCKACFQEYYQEHKEPKEGSCLAENREKGTSELRAVLKLPHLLKALSMGELLFLSIYLRERETKLSGATERELSKRIDEYSEHGGDDLILSLLDTASLINNQIIPDLYDIRYLASLLLEEAGASREMPSVEDFLNRVVWEPISNFSKIINN